MTDSDRRQAIIDGLIQGYWMEIETVLNYLANSIHLDGILAEEIKKSLAADVQGELLHAQTLANRVRELGGNVPGSMRFTPSQTSLQPPADSMDVGAVVRGVLEAEEAAIVHYNALIKLCDGIDYVTQDMCITALADEESHRRAFRGYLKEYERRAKS
ncbi:rubrerythrin [Candidatus Poribacteria bacterium]|nr:rubrerythrin [Candidatus Poribacteria bacterium]